jgi:hypothetical protein
MRSKACTHDIILLVSGWKYCTVCHSTVNEKESKKDDKR